MVSVWLPFAITESTALGVSQLTVNSNGCSISLTGFTRSPHAHETRSLGSGVRFGVIWPDSTKLLSEPWLDGRLTRPPGPVLRGPGDILASSPRQIYTSHWMWPLPANRAADPRCGMGRTRHERNVDRA
ncbi:MAG: hypothetical protein ACLP8S_28015 [Solirubrobacteraceae bacterium]